MMYVCIAYSTTVQPNQLSPVLLQCKLQSTDNTQCSSMPCGKTENLDGHTLVLEFPVSMRKDILAAASAELQLLTDGIIMVPYLTV